MFVVYVAATCTQFRSGRVNSRSAAGDGDTYVPKSGLHARCAGVDFFIMVCSRKARRRMSQDRSWARIRRNRRTTPLIRDHRDQRRATWKAAHEDTMYYWCWNAALQPTSEPCKLQCCMDQTKYRGNVSVE